MIEYFHIPESRMVSGTIVPSGYYYSSDVDCSSYIRAKFKLVSDNYWVYHNEEWYNINSSGTHLLMDSSPDITMLVLRSIKIADVI